MSGWLAPLDRELGAGRAVARVAVADVRGSAPREPGACMLVGNGFQHGTIGGGHLELKAIEIARQLLTEPPGAAPRLDRFALGATLGQCCGGAVNLWFERFDAVDRPFIAAALAAGRAGPAVIATAFHRDGGARRELFRATDAQADGLDDPARAAVQALLDAGCGEERALLLRRGPGTEPLLLERADSGRPRLYLFGAGHVGRALAGVLAELPFDVTWVDSRSDAFPAAMPANVTPLLAESPVEEVARAPRGAWFLVMTHSHDLDYQLCRAILGRDDHAWAGLIGSETKAACFNVRVAREDLPAAAIARLTCPIGSGVIRSKLPGAIAVSVAAQLLQELETAETKNSRRDAEAQRNLA